MNSLNHWNWLKDLEALQQSLDSLLSRSPTHSPTRQEQLIELGWSPVMEIIETDKEYVIKAPLPELAINDLKISAEPGVLTIVGQRRFEAKQTAENHQGLEPVCGSFGRAFSLSDDAGPIKVSAEFKRGVLVVRLSKGEKDKPEQVEIEGS